MPTIRATHDQENPYTCLSNVLLRDPRISFKARGVLALLLSYPDDWEINAKHLAAQSARDGVSAIKSALNELSQAGYLLQEQVKDTAGRFGEFKRIIVETAVFSGYGASSETVDIQASQTTKNDKSAIFRLRRNRSPENPLAEKPLTGKTAHREIDHILNTEFHDLTKLQNTSLLPLSKPELGESGGEREFGFLIPDPEKQENPEPAGNSPQELPSKSPSLNENRDPGLDKNSGGGAAARCDAADKPADVRQTEIMIPTPSEQVGTTLARKEEAIWGTKQRPDLQERMHNWLPAGPWLVNGTLDRNFLDWEAARWMAQWGGDIHLNRKKVRSHFKNDPFNVANCWEEYSDFRYHKTASQVVVAKTNGYIGEADKQDLEQHANALNRLPDEIAFHPGAKPPLPDYAQSLVSGEKPAQTIREAQSPQAIKTAPLQAKIAEVERIPITSEGHCENPGAYKEFRDYSQVQFQPAVHNPAGKPVDYKPEEDPDAFPKTEEEKANYKRLRQAMAPLLGGAGVPAQPKRSEVVREDSERNKLVEALGNMNQRLAKGCKRWLSQDIEQLRTAWERVEFNLRPTVGVIVTLASDYLGLRLEGDELIEEF